MLNCSRSVALPSLAESFRMRLNTTFTVSLGSQAARKRAIVSSVLPSSCGPRLTKPSCSRKAPCARMKKFSVIGALIMPTTSPRLKLPPVTRRYASRSGPGSLVNTRIAPAVLLRPNSVPCGPRSTSSRSKSSTRMTGPLVRGMNTLSMYVPTAPPPLMPRTW